MFEPGRIPKSAVVAALRKQISDLRAQLQSELGIGGGGAARSPAAAAAGGSFAPSPLSAQFPRATATVLDVAAAAGGSGVASSGRVLNALKLVEAQLAVSRQVESGSLAGLSREEQQEMIRLQEENTLLK